MADLLPHSYRATGASIIEAGTAKEQSCHLQTMVERYDYRVI
jgi:hypothetical protein